MNSYITIKKPLSTETSISSKIKNFVCSKNFIVFSLMLFVMANPMFAEEDSIKALDDWGSKILSLMSSSWVKVILLVALVIEAIGLVIAGQQGGGGQIIKKFAPWIIGTLILLSASGIVSYFVKDLKFTVTN